MGSSLLPASDIQTFTVAGFAFTVTGDVTIREPQVVYTNLDDAQTLTVKARAQRVPGMLQVTVLTDNGPAAQRALRQPGLPIEIACVSNRRVQIGDALLTQGSDGLMQTITTGETNELTFTFSRFADSGPPNA